MRTFQFYLLDSMEKVLPAKAPAMPGRTNIKILKNQRYSFQIAYTCEQDDLGESSTRFRLSLEGIDEVLEVRMVELVPCAYPCHGVWDEDYLTTAPGLLPDLLLPISLRDTIKAVPAQWRSLWITIPQETLSVGMHLFSICLWDTEGKLLERFHMEVEVLKESLPRQKLYHTQWFHGDCLADYYNVQVFSEEHWIILQNFIKSAVAHGINTLLTPIFTPPLDTEIGGERTTIQLVQVYEENGEYTFDFSRLRRWADIAKRQGITDFEISHFFTQWGACFAPKVIVQTKNGEEQKFGWHTPAVGGEYTRFLRILLPALKEELDRLVGLEHVWFHISDEPHDSEKETYKAARNSISDLLEGCHVIDALSSYDIYQEGIVKKPVVCNDHIETFLKNGVQGLWTYYCTAQALNVPNRFIAMPSTRNRIMGVLMYLYDIEGFLHWGFNFYNSRCSLKHINPFQVTDAGEEFPSGDAFLVYPAPDKTAWQSIRGEVLKEALQDLRLLQLCEKRIGREATLEIIKGLGGHMDFEHYPRNKKFFEDLWEEILSRIMKG